MCTCTYMYMHVHDNLLHTIFTIFLFCYRPKHPVKVHVWAGISMRGTTRLIIFDGIMDAEFYIHILEYALLPSARKLYPGTNYLFMQDNDPKHTSRRARAFFAENEIEWWKTPPESPDLNPIENLWHELKEYIRREVKPMIKADLITGIKAFWGTVDTPKCQKYIGHLRKVIPKVIEVQGAPSGY